MISIKVFGKKDVNWEEYEFHVLPTITFASASEGNLRSKGIAFEWGFWAIAFYIIYAKIVTPNSTNES